MIPTAIRAPLLDAAPALQPVSALEDTLGVEVCLQDAVALAVEVGVGAELHRLALEEDERLEEGVSGSPDADLLDPTDEHTIERDRPLGLPARVDLGLSGRQAKIHAGTVTRATVKARAERIRTLHAEGHGPEVIAVRVGLSQRQVNRWLNRLVGESWKRAAPRVTDEQKQRVLQLAADQVPPLWIAETVHVSRKIVDQVRADAEMPLDREWNKVRLQIQADPTLFALHKQFRPLKDGARRPGQVSRKDDHN